MVAKQVKMFLNNISKKLPKCYSAGSLWTTDLLEFFIPAAGRVDLILDSECYQFTFSAMLAFQRSSKLHHVTFY